MSARFRDFLVPEVQQPLCGVYLIRCTTTQKSYVGSSVDVSRRLAEHRRLLVAGRHYNKHFQAVFSKYGKEQFEFLVHCVGFTSKAAALLAEGPAAAESRAFQFHCGRSHGAGVAEIRSRPAVKFRSAKQVREKQLSR